MLLPLLLNLGMFGEDVVRPSGGRPDPEFADSVSGRGKYKKKKKLEKLIQQIAERQVEALVVDDQKIYEELERELELRNIEFETAYLEELRLKREILIHQEIRSLMKKKMDEEDELVILILTSQQT